MRDPKLLTLSWPSFSRWVRECVVSSFVFKGGQYLSYDYLEPIATQITHDVRPQIVDAPLKLISRMGQGACISIFWLERRPLYPMWTVMDHFGNFTVNSRISECGEKDKNPKCWTGDWTWSVYPTLVMPAGWRDRVQVWTTKKHQVGFLDRSGSQLTNFSSPNLNWGQVTQTCCSHYVWRNFCTGYCNVTAVFLSIPGPITTSHLACHIHLY